ncbi:MAG: ABC transporter ATP-binding protein [Deltaproteobacteria bacterium]|nr:ABC transporter ATP-binding protein [Deltaproteobacteria bacterium]
MAASLEVKNLTKSYQRKGQPPFVAVRDLSFEVMPGEIFGLLGPNGAGKSTTINCLTGFYPPTAGEILIEGFDIHQSPKKAKQHLGVCSQEDTLDTDFDVLDQMLRYGTFYRLDRFQIVKRARELLETLGLMEKSNELIENLSGGMRRKLQVARALIANPKVLVLDEPTTGLDPDARRTLWQLLIDNRKLGMATLLSTHYMEEAERLCDRIAILFQGAILDLDTPQKLIEKHIGIEIIEEEIRPGVFWKRNPNLEDVFLKLTGKSLSAGEES